MIHGLTDMREQSFKGVPSSSLIRWQNPHHFSTVEICNLIRLIHNQSEHYNHLLKFFVFAYRAREDGGYGG